MYADDLALVAETADDLQRMLVALHEYARKWHLLVNTIKTKVVKFNRCHTGEENTKIAAQKRRELRLKHSFTYNSNNIEIVKQFKYLAII